MNWSKQLIPPTHPCSNISDEEYHRIFPNAPKRFWERGEGAAMMGAYGDKLERFVQKKAEEQAGG